MEAQKTIPVGTELSADDLLTTLSDVFGQNDEVIKQCFPILAVEQKLTFTFELDKHPMIRPPEGALLNSPYFIYVEDEKSKPLAVIYIMPTVDPKSIAVAWTIYDEDLQKELEGKLYDHFTFQ